MMPKNNKKKVFLLFLFIYPCIFFFSVRGIYARSEISSIKNSKEQSAKFIKELVTECLNIVNNSDMSDDQKREKLSGYINKFLDVDRIAQAVFSRMGYKALPPGDQNKVKAYLKKYLLHFYAGSGKLSAMMNAKLLADPVAEPKGEDFAVSTQFTKNSALATKIVWVIKGQKIYYIEVEDINQIITLRSEMQAAIGSQTLMEYINRNSDE
jgi:ABC-type transporter MlaC component